MRTSPLLLAATLTASALSAQAPRHPLDGLSGTEHWAAYDAIRSHWKTDSTTRYAYMGLHEPPKSEVLAWRPGQPFRREATVHLVQGGKGYEAVVDLLGKKVLSWSEAPGRQYMPTESENEAIGDLMRDDPRVRKALTARGYTDFDTINCFAANNPYFDLPEERGKRIARAACEDTYGAVSGWGRPVEGLVAVVDITAMRILRVLDDGARPRGMLQGEHHAEAVGPVRAAAAPITIAQPMGPSFTLDGQQVTWQNWKFHFRIDPRRGIVLSMVRYADGDRERMVMYQGSLSELVVPYMDPKEPWVAQAFFDLGTYPSLFGGVASTLEPGLDCPANAVYVNSMVMKDKGGTVERARAACLFERLSGDPAWRHSRERGSVIESRARRDLVLRMILTAGNYDYLFDWVLRQDASIGINVGATGVDQVKGAMGKDATAGLDDMAYGRFIAPFLIGINHSHHFSFRLDLDVDGQANSVVVDKLVTDRLAPGAGRKSIWKVESSTARTEADGKRHTTMTAPELWRVVNPAVKGAYGDPVGYEIGGGHGAMTLMLPDDYLQQRAAFTNHTLWVTPHAAAELYAAGDYPTGGVAGDGLAKWTAANRPVADTDVVVWYSMGFHHVPRPEDWPVMPVAWHGFEIRPVGFFARNPAIDLPRTP
jgi:primary-amine oxidase